MQIKNQKVADLLSRHHTTIIHKAQCGIALVDSDNKIIYVNEKYAAALEYTTAELLGRKFEEITHPEDVEADTAMLNAILSGETDCYEMTKRYISKTGKIVWVRLSVKGLYTEEGRVLEVFLPQVLKIDDPEITKLLEQFKQSLVAANTQLQVIKEQERASEARKAKVFAFIEKHWQKIVYIVIAAGGIFLGVGADKVAKVTSIFMGS